jgi:hypothetical protein
MTHSFPALFTPLTAVAAAIVHEDGTLVWANVGFRRLIASGLAATEGEQVAHCFIQPAWSALVKAAPSDAGVVYEGLLTLGDFEGSTYSLRGTITRDGHALRLLAEHDIAELQRLNESVLALNRDYAASQLELAHAYVGLQQANAALAQQRTELEASLARVRRVEGFLSICASCNKVRAARDWQFLDQYVQENSDATFHYGLCPECHARQGGTEVSGDVV